MNQTEVRSDAEIIPYLWFDNAAEEAAHLYTGLFPDSKILFMIDMGLPGLMFQSTKVP